MYVLLSDNAKHAREAEHRKNRETPKHTMVSIMSDVHNKDFHDLFTVMVQF